MGGSARSANSAQQALVALADQHPATGQPVALAAAFPGSAEKVSHGRPAFYTTKVIEHARSLVVQPDPDDLRALLGEPRVYVPAYLVPSGWVGVDLDERTDWTELTELLDDSYRLTAPKRAIVQLDARHGPP